MTEFPLLFSPIDLNGLTLANRTVLTAMVTRLSGTDGYVNQDIVDRYLRFARGEVGLIVVEAVAPVARRHAHYSPHSSPRRVSALS